MAKKEKKRREDEEAEASRAFDEALDRTSAADMERFIEAGGGLTDLRPAEELFGKPGILPVARPRNRHKAKPGKAG